MKLHDNIDFTALNWVKQELDATLKRSRDSLEAYVDNPSDVGLMRSSAEYLHQVQGTLRMEIEEHTSELQSLCVISYAVFCLDRKSVV